MTEDEDFPFLAAILFKRHQAKLPATELRKGQRIVLRGKIGDAQKNGDGLESYHGATAIYHLQNATHPIFFVGLEDVTITRVNPTEEQLAVHRLSDKPNLDRESWKILEVDNRADAQEIKARRAFDGDESTVWQADGKDGKPGDSHSLVVDMGRSQTITGIRYLPPLDRNVNGSVGKFSLYVSDSPKMKGTPVATGTFRDDRVEQETGFKKIAGRYFRFVGHPVAEGKAGIAIAEWNLLGEAIKIPDVEREPKLPPLAEEIERFDFLRDQFAEPPAALQLTPAQRVKWLKVHSEAKSRWYYRHQMPISELLNKKEWLAVNRAAARKDLSPVENANFYAVAASPKFSNEDKRKEMTAISKVVREERVAFLSEIKRILSARQQAKLKEIIAAHSLKHGTIEGPWTDLFDGKSLRGWDGDPKYWTVKDGAITGVNSEEKPNGGKTFLIYVGESKYKRLVDFGDFELKLEYRIIGDNSGIQYRSFKIPGKANRWRVGGYQADFDAVKASVGAIYEEQGRGLLAKRGQVTSIDTTDGGSMLKGITSLDDPGALAAKVKNAPEWNESHIIALGNRLTYYINGVQMSKVVDNNEAHRRNSGLIAIELQTGVPMTVQARRVRIRTAGSPSTRTPEE